MEKFFENLPAIIHAAAQSHLGLMALLIVALSALAFSFFSKASEAARIVIFLLLFSGAVGFGWAMLRVAPQTIDVAAQDKVGAEHKLEPTSEPKPAPRKERWLTYRYDIFWCDSAPQEAKNFASRVSTSLKSAGVADIRIKRYDAGFRERAKVQGFSPDIYNSASIRYYGLEEEKAAKQAQTFLNRQTGGDFELEEVSSYSPTPGILSIFVCPGFSGAQQGTPADR